MRKNCKGGKLVILIKLALFVVASITLGVCGVCMGADNVSQPASASKIELIITDFAAISPERMEITQLLSKNENLIGELKNKDRLIETLRNDFNDKVKLVSILKMQIKELTEKTAVLSGSSKTTEASLIRERANNLDIKARLDQSLSEIERLSGVVAKKNKEIKEAITLLESFKMKTGERASADFSTAKAYEEQMLGRILVHDLDSSVTVEIDSNKESVADYQFAGAIKTKQRSNNKIRYLLDRSELMMSYF